MNVVYTARQLAADALDEAAEPDLSALTDDLEIWLTDLFREGRTPTGTPATPSPSPQHPPTHVSPGPP